MSTNAAVATNTPPVMSGDEFSPEEIAILKGETPPETVPSAPASVEDEPAPEAANDDIGAEEIETEDPDQPRDEKGRFVPKSAYLRVKEENKSTNQKLAQVAAELIRQRERHAVMQDLIQSASAPRQPQAEPEREISPEEDIFGAYKQLAAKLERMQQSLGERDTQTRAQIQAMQLQAAATQDLQSFAAKEPAFMEAYGYLQSQRHQELEALGVADPARREQIIRQEARELIEGALTSRQSAAERIWKLAQARGYRAKPQNAPAIDPKAAEQIERINRGKEASATLRGAGTTADTGQPLTLAKLIDMSEAEYLRTRDSYVQKHGKAAWERLTSGR